MFARVSTFEGGSPEQIEAGLALVRRRVLPELREIPGYCGVISLVVLIASIQMMRLRGHGLAVAGSVLAMLNLGNLCCILGLPFGIWSLVVLMRPDVRNAFQGVSPPPER